MCTGASLLVALIHIFACWIKTGPRPPFPFFRHFSYHKRKCQHPSGPDPWCWYIRLEIGLTFHCPRAFSTPYQALLLWGKAVLPRAAHASALDFTTNLYGDMAPKHCSKNVLSLFTHFACLAQFFVRQHFDSTTIDSVFRFFDELQIKVDGT